MKHVLFLAAALLSAAAYSQPEDSPAVPPCLMCRDQLKKEMEGCKSHPVGEARDLCRANAQAKAKECGKSLVGQCNLDLLMDSPKKAEPAKPKREG